jgi:hypothetical protein
MPPPRHALTPQVEEKILAFIRAGGYPHVAAEAAGVPRAVFEGWLGQGRSTGRPTKYRAFFEAVQQARAQARLKAETTAFKDKPLDWLKSGPGRETSDYAGWTGPARPQAADGRGNPLLDPEVQNVFARLRAALVPFPDACTAAARALAETRAGPHRP